jgi:hypothetical protein
MFSKELASNLPEPVVCVHIGNRVEDYRRIIPECGDLDLPNSNYHSKPRPEDPLTLANTVIEN